MAIIGYLYEAVGDETLSEAREKMEDYGCVRIFSDTPRDEQLRPKWKEVMELLTRGDELVLSKFSNAVRSTGDLSNIIEYCRVKVVRLISIGDRIDTHGKLFPRTSALDVLAMVGCLPEESLALRQHEKHISIIKRVAQARPAVVINKHDREVVIVNMYHQGYSIREIQNASGYSSEVSIFRILNKHGVTLNRGNHSGPTGPHKKKDTMQ